jgi:hypothetical protein
MISDLLSHLQESSACGFNQSLRDMYVTLLYVAKYALRLCFLDSDHERQSRVSLSGDGENEGSVKMSF